MTAKDLVAAAPGSGFVTASVHKGPPGPPMTIAFPCFAGPSLRGLTTVLLYREKIHVSIPSLLDEEQYSVFRQVGDYANENGLACLEAFVLAHQHFMLAVEQYVDERKSLAPLDDHFEFMQIFNDASPEWFANALETCDQRRLKVVQAALDDTQQMNVASREFIWRVFSAHLNLDGDRARIADYLERHLTARGSVGGLLAESLLNRYLLLGEGMSATAFASADERTAQIVSELAQDAASHERTIETSSDLLAFVLFDELLSKHVGTLVAPNVDRIAKLFADRARELRAMRERCRREASQLVNEAMEPNAFVRRVTDTLENCREEVSSLLEMTSSTFSKMTRGLAESAAFWTSLAGLAGAAIADVHAAIPSALGAAAVGQVASAAIKARNERRDLIKTSHWALVYHAIRTK